MRSTNYAEIWKPPTSSQDNKSPITRKDYDYSISSFIAVAHECSGINASFWIGNIVSIAKLARGQVSNLPVHWFEMQKECHFLGTPKPSYVFAKHWVKGKPYAEDVSTDAVLVRYTNFDENGTISAAVHKNLRDDSCIQFRDSNQPHASYMKKESSSVDCILYCG